MGPRIFRSSYLRFFRRSADESLAPNGRVQRVGRYERWVRKIAVLGIIQVALVVTLTGFRIREVVGSVSNAVAAIALLGLSVVTMLGLIARARGFGFPARKLWNRSEVWGTWSGVCLLTAIFSDPRVHLFRIVAMLSMLIPIAASVLDRAGLPENVSPGGNRTAEDAGARDGR